MATDVTVFTGICIGGPDDGLQVTWEKPSYTVQERINPTSWDEPALVSTATYHWSEFGPSWSYEPGRWQIESEIKDEIQKESVSATSDPVDIQGLDYAIVFGLIALSALGLALYLVKKR